ncbi:PhzF family phenazine biosynthesis protein [bacterium]|jgi:trans-2,3-dihydro-3-hydroxyanthranilate isomerase|nr:PhzF family phenazine biosynthesis protein [bacterium]MBT4291139.1 PhzF family phenazine biosynthesis protein [bacterium]
MDFVNALKSDPFSFMLIDVFTDKVFGGSKLTFFPFAGKMSRALMQSIAKEMGSGETAFADISDNGTGTIHLFTPSVSILATDLALIGATCAVDELGLLADSTGFKWLSDDGEHSVQIEETESGKRYSTSHLKADFIGQYYKRSSVAKALGLVEQDISITGLPCEIVSTGLPIHIVPVGTLAAVEKISIKHSACHDIVEDLGFGDMFVFVCDSENPGVDIHCRFFAHGFGIPEDPASGTACSALMAYLVKHRLVATTSDVHITCEQGMEIGQPSRLYLSAKIVAGEASEISVGGECVVVGFGKLTSRISS